MFITRVISGLLTAASWLLLCAGVLILAYSPLMIVIAWRVVDVWPTFLRLIAMGTVLAVSGLLLRFLAEAGLNRWEGWAALGLVVLTVGGPSLWIWKRAHPPKDPEIIKYDQYLAWVESTRKFTPLFEKFDKMSRRDFNYLLWRERNPNGEEAHWGEARLKSKFLIMGDRDQRLTKELMSALPPDLSPANPEEVGTVAVVRDGMVLVYDAQSAVDKQDLHFNGVAAKKLSLPERYWEEGKREAAAQEVVRYLISLPRK